MIIFCTIIAVQVLAQEANRDTKKSLITGCQHLALTNVIDETQKTETIFGESNSSAISHINLSVKHIGKRNVGKPHTAFTGTTTQELSSPCFLSGMDCHIQNLNMVHFGSKGKEIVVSV